MTKKNDNLFSDVIEAAGGLLWRETPDGREIALVHRPQYDDWCLPKGKRDPGESWQQTALREIEEETCCKADLSSFAGSTAYSVKGVAKIVLYWEMSLVEEKLFEPDKEVDKLIWLPIKEAIDKLDYENEKAILREFLE